MSKQESSIVNARRLAGIALFLGAGYVVGFASRDTTVQADTRRSEPKQQHFQSGAQRSEGLLREMSATLGKMDARLERMEKLAKQFVSNSAQSPTEAR
ncbi:MAG: hypothetical protein H8E66_31145 [Planctomycetes bacterium]|nr:hypothetical protein [Planctomycetota bacterium]